MSCIVIHDELAMDTSNRKLKLAYNREKKIAQEEPASELG
jgi:peptidyl-tRNA hydrolase